MRPRNLLKCKVFTWFCRVCLAWWWLGVDKPNIVASLPENTCVIDGDKKCTVVLTSSHTLQNFSKFLFSCRLLSTRNDIKVWCRVQLAQISHFRQHRKQLLHWDGETFFVTQFRGRENARKWRRKIRWDIAEREFVCDSSPAKTGSKRLKQDWWFQAMRKELLRKPGRNLRWSRG